MIPLSDIKYNIVVTGAPGENHLPRLFDDSSDS